MKIRIKHENDHIPTSKAAIDMQNSICTLGMLAMLVRRHTPDGNKSIIYTDTL
jgi:hypothetical protein